MTPPLTDEFILRVMRARSIGIMTYVIRNILVMEHGFPRSLTSAQIRRRLARLEQAGKVRQVPSGYAVMLCWAIA